MLTSFKYDREQSFDTTKSFMRQPGDMECSHALSREEQEELLRSKKKLKTLVMRGSKKSWIQLLRLRGTMEVIGVEPRFSKTN